MTKTMWVMFIVYNIVLTAVHISFNWSMPLFSIVCTYASVNGFLAIGAIAQRT